jgi:hypothetical protein
VTADGRQASDADAPIQGSDEPKLEAKPGKELAAVIGIEKEASGERNSAGFGDECERAGAGFA